MPHSITVQEDLSLRVVLPLVVSLQQTRKQPKWQQLCFMASKWVIYHQVCPRRYQLTGLRHNCQDTPFRQVPLAAKRHLQQQVNSRMLQLPPWLKVRLKHQLLWASMDRRSIQLARLKYHPCRSQHRKLREVFSFKATEIKYSKWMWIQASWRALINFMEHFTKELFQRHFLLQLMWTRLHHLIHQEGSLIRCTPRTPICLALWCPLP